MSKTTPTVIFWAPKPTITIYIIKWDCLCRKWSCFQNAQEKPKPSEEKKTNEVDDLFASTGSIFDDLPKKSKDKKKKKAAAAKEENIFDNTKGIRIYFLVYILCCGGCVRCSQLTEKVQLSIYHWSGGSISDILYRKFQHAIPVWAILSQKVKTTFFIAFLCVYLLRDVACDKFNVTPSAWKLGTVHATPRKITFSRGTNRAFCNLSNLNLRYNIM